MVFQAIVLCSLTNQAQLLQQSIVAMKKKKMMMTMMKSFQSLVKLSITPLEMAGVAVPDGRPKSGRCSGAVCRLRTVLWRVQNAGAAPASTLGPAPIQKMSAPSTATRKLLPPPGLPEPATSLANP